MNPASEVGAFFDLDRTLLPAPSIERRFLRYAFCHGKVGPRQWLKWAARFAARITTNPRAATQGNKACFAGMPKSVVAQFEARLAAKPLRFFSAGLELLEWHTARGHRVFLVTGAPEPLAEIVARRLPVPVEILATRLEEQRGNWTGEISGEHMRGAAKRRAIERLAAAEGLDLAHSFACGDSYSDVAMLESVAFPTVVNPGELLARLARRRGWPILEWHAMQAQTAAPSQDNTRKKFQRRTILFSFAKPSLEVNR